MNEVPISDSAMTMTQSVAFSLIIIYLFSFLDVKIHPCACHGGHGCMITYSHAILDMWVMVSLKMVRFSDLPV
jgi:hypothetical protein